MCYIMWSPYAISKMLRSAVLYTAYRIYAQHFSKAKTPARVGGLYE